MRRALTTVMALALLALAGTARAQSLAELGATMATGNALSAGAANGAATAHSAMSTVLRNLPPATPLPADGDTAHTSGAGGSGKGSWQTASSGRQASGQSSWAKGGSSSGGHQGSATTWAHASSGRQSGSTSTWATAGGCR
jgi:hypothetical protein